MFTRRLIDIMDRGIGRIIDAVKAGGRADNTLVMFLADNGGCAETIDRGTPGVPAGDSDSFLSYGRAWANASNTPFRLYKHWVHEGGISTPLIACWPKVTGAWSAADRPALTGRDVGQRGVVSTPAGRLVRDVGHVIDLMANCLRGSRVFNATDDIEPRGRTPNPMKEFP